MISKKSFKKTVAIFSAAISIGGIVFFHGDINNILLNCQKKTQQKNHLDRNISDVVNEFSDQKGNYSEQRIVLKDIGKDEAENLAEMIGAEIRVSALGDIAVLYLDESTTIQDIYENKNYSEFIPNMYPDYYGSLCSDANDFEEDEDVFTTKYDSFDYLSNIVVFKRFDDCFIILRNANRRCQIGRTGYSKNG